MLPQKNSFGSNATRMSLVKDAPSVDAPVGTLID
jgi:hypothetical protein